MLAYYIHLIVLTERRSVGQLLATTNNNKKADETAKIIYIIHIPIYLMDFFKEKRSNDYLLESAIAEGTVHLPLHDLCDERDSN